MPIVAKTETQDTAEIEELVSFMLDNKIDTTSEDAMLSTAEVLKKISNNKTIVADEALESLKTRNDFDPSRSTYGPQTIMLHYDRRQNFFVRANFWPSENDHIFRSSSAKSFFYEVPHDHNFNFMTVGHIGPGYRSNYYEYDYTEVDGYVGEKVDLKFVEHMALEEGKVMLYRAYKDVHDQRPGDSMSMSINIMENTLRGSFMDQYEFDVDQGCITKVLNQIPATSLLPIVAMTKDDNGHDYLMEVAKGHKSGLVRCHALGALASVQANVEAAQQIYISGSANDQQQVRGYCENQLKALSELAQ